MTPHLALVRLAARGLFDALLLAMSLYVLRWLWPHLNHGAPFADSTWCQP